MIAEKIKQIKEAHMMLLRVKMNLNPQGNCLLSYPELVLLGF